MAIGEAIIVIGAIQIGRHDTYKVGAILAFAAFAKLDASDFTNGVGFVGLFERASKAVILLDRLRAFARVDAAGAEKA